MLPARLELPVLRRELLGLLRTRRAFWLLVLAVALSSLIPLERWPRAGRMAAGQFSDNSAVIASFLVAQLAAVLVVVPVFTAGAVAGERERGTWDLLLGTRLSPASILCSKALASFGYVLILLIALSPSSYSLQLLGGASFRTIADGYVATLATGCMATCVSLVESLRSERIARATVRGFVSVLLWSSQPVIILIWIFVRLFRILAGKTSGFLYSRQSRTNPLWTWFAATVVTAAFVGLFVIFIMAIVAVVSAFQPATGSMAPMPFVIVTAEIEDPSMRHATLSYSLYAALVAAGHAIYLLRNVLRVDEARRRDIRHRPRIALRTEPARSARARPRPRSLLTKVASSREGNRSAFPGNTIYLKEIRTEFHGSAAYARATFWGPLPLLVGTMLATGGTRLGAVRGAFLAASVICLLITPAIAGTSITREDEQGNLDLLRGTHLGTLEILRGKLYAALHACAGVVAALAGALILALAGLLMSALVSPSLPDLLELWFSLIASSLVLVILTTYSAAAGLLASVVARRSTPALLSAYGLALVPAGYWLLTTGGKATVNHEGYVFLVCMAAGAACFWAIASWWFDRFRMRDR